LLKIKELRPDVESGLFSFVPNFVPSKLPSLQPHPWLRSLELL
jgi:hypothetical protein